MWTEIFDILRELVSVLKDGGPYAVAAIFIILWYRENRYTRKLAVDVQAIAMAKVEGDVKTERTLDANAQALRDVDGRLHGISHAFEGVVKQVGECSQRNQKLLEAKWIDD